MISKTANRVLQLAREKGLLRPRDLDEYGIARIYLSRLHKKNLLRKAGRGLYILADAEPTKDHTIAQVCKRMPHGVVCLLSALQFHEMTTQLPFEVWLAIDRKGWLPQASDLPVRIVRFSKVALTEGVEEHIIEGVKVRVYNPAKTVADCFKYRNKVGLDVALEALRECWRERKCTSEDLYHYAKICRVWRVMRPYLEAIS